MAKDILNSNFFELFDHDVSFDIDLDHIQQQYMALQKQVHPDKFASASDQQKRLSMQQTSWINEALSTLKDDVLRATYMLKLKGIDINMSNETTVDTVFLMQQMEMREQLEHVRHDDDPLTAIDKLAAGVKQAIATARQEFSCFYDLGQLEAARECVRKLQFLNKTRIEIDAVSADIEDELMG